MKSICKAVSCFIVMTFVLASTFASAKTMNGIEIKTGQWKGQSVEYLDREILVGLNSDKIQADLIAELGILDVKIVRQADRFGFLKLHVGKSENLFTTIAAIEKLSSVRYAEPNMVDHQFVIPNDPEFNTQWHYHNTGQNPPGGTIDSDIDAPEGWDVSTGSSTIMVGVLDSGIPIQGGVLSHPDLDDPTRYFFGIDISNGDSEPADDNGHGTHVSGTIAAETNNGIGVAGVSWNASIMAIKVFDQNGSGSHENFRDGCIYATDNGCKVINYSGGGSEGAAKEHGVAYADTHGVVICAAAGNNWQGSVSWPGAYSTTYTNVICVSSTNHHDASSPFSSIGPSVTISAPGGHGSPYDDDDVISTFPDYTVQLNTDLGLPLNYAPLAGTSMATPHVAGFAALILGMNSNLTPDSVRQIMINTSDDLGPAGFDNQFGWGRINIYNALSQMGGISISHTPLEDTKEIVLDYEVLCTIYSDTTLHFDSLFLYYRLDGGAYIQDLLTATANPDEYTADIPVQTAGTDIDYYLEAHSTSGEADTTDVYSFRIIDYAVLLDPSELNGTGPSMEDIWYDLDVINNGVFTDSYNLTTSNNIWTTTFWDETMTTQITSVGPLAADDTVAIKVKVEIPSSVYGESDLCNARATSQANMSIYATSVINTISAGQPVVLPFFDDFPFTTIDPGNWVQNTGIEINSTGMAEPSEPYSVNLNGDPDGADTLMSQAINLAATSGVNISYSYQQGGGGDAPEVGDDLFVEYFNDQGQWVLLNQHFGADPEMTLFETYSVGVPIDGYHAAFRLRFRSLGTAGSYDDWFVDDVRVDYGPAISASPSSYFVTLAPVDSTTEQLIIENSGQGGLTYSIDVIPDLSKMNNTFAGLYSSGSINPAHGVIPDEWVNYEEFKGADDFRQGDDVIFNAGGPDAYGYYWIDSDEAGGPVFNWIDISATGTDITSGFSDDNFLGPYTIGFSFPFYEGNYSDFYVTSNGYIGFGPTTSYNERNNSAIPTSSSPNNIICWCWDDLDITNSSNTDGKVYYELVGADLVIQFVNFPEYQAATGDVITAEIILSPDGGIKIQYLSIATGFDVLSSTVGIENEDGSDGLQVVFNTTYLHDNLAVEFFKPVQWLTLDSYSGNLPSGEADTLNIYANSTGLEDSLYVSNITIHSNDPDPGDNPLLIPFELTVEIAPQYICGDADGTEEVDVSDAVYLIAFVFAGGPLPDPWQAGDADCSGELDISDAVYIVAYVFNSGPAPCEACP